MIRHVRKGLWGTLCCLALWLAGTGLAGAEPVTVEGVAPIMLGDLAQARQNAIRDALAEAARKNGVTVDATLGTNRAQEVVNQTVIRSSARIGAHRIVSERHDAENYHVTLQAEVLPVQDSADPAVCRGGHGKRLLIGGFPLLHPEHLQTGEMSGIAQLTAAELARRFGPDSPVLTAIDGGLMVHYPEAETAVGGHPGTSGAMKLIRAAAERQRAQYLLLGRFRSLELGAGRSGRKLELETLIVDGANGSILARRIFRREAGGQASLPDSIPFGSAAFYDSDLGRAYGELLSDVARWARAAASCQPFFARVIKVEGKSVYLDAGSEQGIAVGDTLSATRTETAPVMGANGAVLGHPTLPLGEMEIKAVSPRFAIGELANRRPPGQLAPGDLLHAR